jgi:hypothetical protein
LTVFGVAAIIGAGIFVFTGVAAATEAGLIWLAIGLVVYFLYSRHHSQLEAGDATAGQSRGTYP